MAELQGQPVSSLKDTERELAKAADMAGLSQEFYALLAERDELAQQRGDLAARVVEVRKLLADLRSGFEDIGKLAGLYVTAIDAGMGRDSRPVNVASDIQPSEQTR